MKTLLVIINKLFETYWLPILLVSGALSVNPEIGVILSLYAFLSIKLVDYIVRREIPESSVEQHILIVGSLLIVSLHYFFLNDSLLNYNLLNWIILLTAPFYLLKGLSIKEGYVKLILYTFFVILLFGYFSGTPSGQNHLNLSNTNIVALITLFLGIKIQSRSRFEFIINHSIVCLILVLLSNKGCLILYSIIIPFLFLKKKNYRKIYLSIIFSSLALAPFFINISALKHLKEALGKSYGGRVATCEFFNDYFWTTNNKIIGNGFGSAEIIADNTNTKGKFPFIDITRLKHVHNELIELLIEGGILWLLVILISFFYFFYRNIKEGNRLREKALFIVVFLITIQIYSSYRNGVLYSILPLFALSYGFKTINTISSKSINRITFLFYLILIPTLLIATSSKFRAFENLRSPNIKNINAAINLNSHEPYFYYVKLKLLHNNLNAKEDFYRTKETLDSIHPNYKKANSILASYKFRQGEPNAAYKIIKEASLANSLNIEYHYYLIYYASYINEKVLEEEILELFKKAIYKDNLRKNIDLKYTINNKVLTISNRTNNKDIALDLDSIKNTVLGYKTLGYVKFTKEGNQYKSKGFKGYKNWLSIEMIKKTFDHRGLCTGGPNVIH